MSEEKKSLTKIEEVNLIDAELESLGNLLVTLPDEDVPAELRTSMRQAYGMGGAEEDAQGKRRAKIAKKEKESIKKAKQYAYGAVAAAAVFFLVLASTWMFDGSNDYVESAYDNSTSKADAGNSRYIDEEKSEEEKGADSKSSIEENSVSQAPDSKEKTRIENTKVSDRKLIYRSSLTLKVEDCKQSISKLKSMAESSGGYVESSHQRTHYSENTDKEYYSGYVVLRIPQEKYAKIMTGLDSLGELSDLNESIEDVSSAYRDTESEALNLEAREKSLRKLMDKAETMEDTLAVDRELSAVRNRINDLRGTLTRYDRLVSLATISVDIVETEKESGIKPIDQSLGSRIKQSFNHTVNRMLAFGENLAVLAIGRSPFYLSVLLIFAICFFVIRFVLKKILKRVQGHLQNKEEKR